MPKFIVTVVHTESTHFEVEADSADEAKEAARECWVNDTNMVNLGTEFADIERVYIDDEEFEPSENV